MNDLMDLMRAGAIVTKRYRKGECGMIYHLDDGSTAEAYRHSREQKYWINGIRVTRALFHQITGEAP